jgi:hypothetical protein
MTTFEYNGKIISTPNLEKKLKRMKLSMEEIKIVSNPEIKKEYVPEIEDYMKDKEQVIIKCKLDDIQRVCYVKKGTRPQIKDILGKWYSEEQLESMYYDE